MKWFKFHFAEKKEVDVLFDLYKDLDRRIVDLDNFYFEKEKFVEELGRQVISLQYRLSEVLCRLDNVECDLTKKKGATKCRKTRSSKSR
jgi:hypothetical protein